MLWLLRFPPYGERHIHAEAAARGIDPARVIFTDVAAKPVSSIAYSPGDPHPNLVRAGTNTESMGVEASSIFLTPYVSPTRELKNIRNQNSKRDSCKQAPHVLHPADMEPDVRSRFSLRRGGFFNVLGSWLSPKA